MGTEAVSSNDRLQVINADIRGAVKMRCKMLAMCLVVMLVSIPCSVRPASAAATEASKTPFGLADMWGVREVSNVQISPDGSHVAYVLTTSDISHDLRRSEIHLVDLRSDADQIVSNPGDNASDPVWSPEGRLAFVTAAGGGAKVVFPGLSGAKTEELSLPHAPRFLAWSRDGMKISYFATEPAPRRVDLSFAVPSGAQWAPPGRVIDSPEFQDEDNPLIVPVLVNLFVVDAAPGATPREVNAEPLARSLPYFSPNISWAPDGRKIYFSIDRGDFWRDLFGSRVYSVELSTGQIKSEAGIGEYQYAPVVSPDGQMLAYLCMAASPGTYLRRQICIRPLIRGAERALAGTLDRDVHDARWLADGKSLIASYLEHGLTRIARFSVADDRAPAVIATTAASAQCCESCSEEGGASSVSRGGVMAFVDADDLVPGEAALLLPDGKVKRLTASNVALLRARGLARTESVTFHAADSWRPVEGFLTLPPDGQGKEPYPTLVLLHGGQSAADGPRFCTDAQVFAAHGYAVLRVNYRGSGGYGSELGNTLVYPKGVELDVLGGVDELVRRGVADATHLFIAGGSGGGATTGWVIAHSNRFIAAAMWYPPVNWQDGQLESATGFTTQKHQWGEMPWDNPAQYAALSPITFVNRITTPTLLVVGDKDRITPMSGAIAYFNALQWRRIPSRLVLMPDEPHGVDRRPSHAMGLLADTIAWFAEHGGPPLMQPVWQ